MNSLSSTELVANAKEATENAKADLLKTFAFVPEDRLMWSPSPTARTPLWIAAHCGVANSIFAALLRGEPIPLPTAPAAAVAFFWDAGRENATREEAVRSIQDSALEIVKALDNATEAMLASSPMTPFGAMPFAFWMQVMPPHMTGHARQIDYLQTIWGDVQDH